MPLSAEASAENVKREVGMPSVPEDEYGDQEFMVALRLSAKAGITTPAPGMTEIVNIVNRNPTFHLPVIP
jgi:hypothetical protein